VADWPSAALLCIYHVWLKINGYKNWDGTPKKTSRAGYIQQILAAVSRSESDEFASSRTATPLGIGHVRAKNGEFIWSERVGPPAFSPPRNSF